MDLLDSLKMLEALEVKFMNLKVPISKGLKKDNKYENIIESCEDEEEDDDESGGLEADLEDKLEIKTSKPEFKREAKHNYVPIKKRIDYKKNVLENAISLIFDSKEQNLKDIKKFRGYTPSKIKLNDGINNVIIRCPGTPKIPNISDDDLTKLKSEFEQLVKGGPTNPEEIEKLARKYGIMTGKWLLMIEINQADKIWQKIVDEMFSIDKDRLINPGLGILEISITTLDNNEDSPYRNIKISIRTSNYTNKREIFDILKVLRKIGVTNTLKYKPDVFSKLDIYSGNSYGLRPTLYTDYKIYKQSKN